MQNLDVFGRWIFIFGVILVVVGGLFGYWKNPGLQNRLGPLKSKHPG